ncbi:MAG TPA: phosphomannomutase/phosphoglucomutase [Candidatus Onthousia faecavium]|nr:phosphomannomutase/phosphoglucomutase [Candidatus Onthousia faecavium]
MQIKKDLNKYIFRGYDIRGVVPQDIDVDTAYTIGLGFGSKIQDLKREKCVVGYDNRISSPDLHQALVQGLIDTGVNVIDIGLTTTPMYYFACLDLKIDSGIMITASHNPKDENGFKFAFSDYQNAKGEEITDFYNYIMKANFKTGEGTITKKEVKEDYFKALLSNISFGKRKVKVVLDPGNGTTSILLADLFKNIPVDYTIINGESNGTFPNHHPDPSIESNLEELKHAVIESKADVGLAFDGDGDRVGIISNLGKFVPIDYYMIIIIRDIINKVKNKTFLYDVKCSKSLEDEIIKLGGTPYCYRTGNSYTKAKVKELDLPFGGELSGHVYFRDKFLGFDSGIYAGIRLLEILSNTNKSVEELLEGVNKYYSTPEMKYKSRDDIKAKVIEKIQAYCEEKGYNINTIDGVRITFTYGWASVRMSNTGPNITARFEATTKERLEEIKNEFEGLIKKYNN